MASLVLVCLGLIAAGCEPSIPEGRFACDGDDDCPAEMVCRASVGRCYRTDEDAGPARDAGARADSGARDAGVDGGSAPADAGPDVDASAGDAGVDASATDAGVDASGSDAGADAS